MIQFTNDTMVQPIASEVRVCRWTVATHTAMAGCMCCCCETLHASYSLPIVWGVWLLTLLVQWFGFYAPGQDKTILPLEQSPLYLEDWLGLQKLDSAGRLQQLSCIGDHLQFTNEYFIDTVIPYLNVTM